MTDKVQKIREEVEKRYEYWKEKESNSHSIESEIRMSECQHLLLMLDSLQKEPVSEELNIESMIESYEQRLISQANGVKNSPLVDMCLASYKHGINETLDTLKLFNLVRIGKNRKESKFKVGERIKFKGVRNEDVTRVITNIQKGDGGGFRYLFADGSIYSIGDDGIELVEEPVSVDLEEAATKSANKATPYTRVDIGNGEVCVYTKHTVIDRFKAGANWKKEQINKDVDNLINVICNSCAPNAFGTLEQCIAAAQIETLKLIKED